MKKIVLFLSIFFCTACFSNSNTQEVENIEKELTEYRLHFIQLFEELNLLFSFMSENDELDSVVDILEISMDETEQILQQLHNIQPPTKKIQQEKMKLEKLLIHFYNAIHLQYIGIENGNSDTFQEGFLQFELLQSMIIE